MAAAGPLMHIPMFLVWFGAMVIAEHVAYGTQQLSIAVPDPRHHFFIALCAGAAQVRTNMP